MDKMTKLHVVAAVEPTTGVSPSKVLELARQAAPPTSTRVVIADYLPAFMALKEKGYTNVAAAEMLVSLGCPFTAFSIIQRHREMSRGGRRRTTNGS